MTLRSVQSGLEDYRSWACDPTPRIGLGLPFFDDRSGGGMAKAECAMVLAYSSVGKTWVALNTILNNPRIPTVFFSLEMSWRQVVSRLTAMTSGIPTWELEKLIMAGNEPQHLAHTGFQFPYLLGDDRSELTFKDMKVGVVDAGRQLGTPVRLVIIDYLELIGGAGMLGKSEQVDKAGQKVRALAKDCDCSVVVLHQVGKTDGSGGHEPLSLDSGKYGGHQPMDYVIGAYAPRLNKQLTEFQVAESQEDLYLQLLKNRNGRAHPTGVRHRLSEVTGLITPWTVNGQLPMPPRFGSVGRLPAYQPELV